MEENIQEAQKSKKEPGRGSPRRGGFRREKEQKEFEQTIVDLSRVTRVTKGGKQMSFRATVIIGDRKGRVGYAVEKGKDVQIAVDKAVRRAKKELITVPITKSGSIPHFVDSKFGSAKIIIKPAPSGSGLISGGAVRIVLDFAGVSNASSKIVAPATNKINIIKATFDALSKLKTHASR